MSFFNRESKESIDKDLDLYKRGRKLSIDEEVSEYRRQQKNRAVEDVLEATAAWRVDTQKRFTSYHKEDLDHTTAVAKRSAELATLDAQKEAKRREIEQAETDFSARGLLRDRAQKAEKEKHDEVLKEKDAMITHLKVTLDKVLVQHDGLLGKAVDSLGKAAALESSTKVIGFGPSSEQKTVK